MKTVNLVTILLVLMLSVSCSGDSQQQYLREQIATKNGLKEVDISSLKYVHRIPSVNNILPLYTMIISFAAKKVNEKIYE